MEPILKTIAREYTNRYRDLKRMCFLFPNKRCGIYLKKYLAELGKKGDEMPHILTISDFMAQLAHLTEASRIVQLFSLFNSYKKVVGSEKDLDFDSFRGWGETVLSDFNTVDINLADPEEIFKNVKDYREITSDFLTDDQKEVMREYFGVESFTSSEGFWKTFDDPSNISELQKKFLNLWQVLSPLHENFINSLEEKGFGTTGSIYRQAYNRIKQYGKQILPYDKIVTVGFNALTEAERKVFKSLQSMEGETGYDDYADFIWDLSGPLLKGHDFSASRFVDYNKQHFPEPEWLSGILEDKDVCTYPEINIVSSPSLTAQAKVAYEILKRYQKDDELKMIADAEVGLILPDESILPNILYSLPENIREINLTMGYSFRLTPIASFISLLRRLYVSTRITTKGSVYYVKDLKIFFSHPYSYTLFPGNEIENLSAYINQYHKVSLPIDEMAKIIPSAKNILDFPSKKKGSEEIFKFLYNILDCLNDNFNLRIDNAEENLEISQIKIYKEYVEAMEEAIGKFEIETSPVSLMQMIDKLVSMEKIGFEGEPLSGLQVMGTLETRALDFRQVIILSMNEGIMPRKANTSTFIPESLRKAYGLPPSRYAEEIFGYYFYRLISRAEKVTLIYDGRTMSGSKGGVSRYLLQLRQYVPQSYIREESWQYRLESREQQDASIIKTPEILELLNPFTSNGNDRKNFSASSLNTYRECQVKFFLQNLLNINSDPGTSEFMDAISVGNVLHDVMMEIYMPSEMQRKLLASPIQIDSVLINNILNNPHIIKELVEKKISKIYYNSTAEERKPIESGVTEIIAEQIEELVKAILTYDLSLTPFNIYGSEISKKLQIKLPSGRIVNFNFAIDRLDEIIVEGKKQLRIIDYKTGERKRKANSLEEIFEGKRDSEQIFQLFTYAWLLDKLNVDGSDDVATEIYFVPDLINQERGLPEIGKKKVMTFKEYREDFSKYLEGMIEDIFESSKFEETRQPSNCGYCAFKSFCSK